MNTLVALVILASATFSVPALAGNQGVNVNATVLTSKGGVLGALLGNSKGGLLGGVLGGCGCGCR